jgi:ABC-type Mn2+/Zn2+ transport system permease subunit
MILPGQLVLFAVLGAALTGILCSLMGSFVVRMNLSSLGFCMSHAAFAGAALGIVLSLNPLTTAVLFSVFIAFILGPLAEKARLKTDIVIGVLFSLTISLGFIFLNFAPGTAMSSTALSILWGSILGITATDILHLMMMVVGVVLIVILFFKEFQAILFSRKLAEASGINRRPFYYLILLLTGVVVALSLKLVGGLLIFALLVNPASAAYQFFYDMKKITVFSPIIGVFCCLLGILLSFYLDLPTGASIAITSSLIFGISVIFSPKRKRG